MATYFVSPSPTGNDSNVGSAASPWATLAHAEAVVVAGDTVNINNGSYAGFTTSKNGTSAAVRIIFTAVSPGNVTLTSQITCLNNFRTFNGFVFNNVGDRAFDLTGANNIIQNMTVNINYGVGYGIKIGQDAVNGGTSTSNNVVDGVRVVSTFSGSPNSVHGVIIGGGGSGNVLKNSYVSNTGYGIVNKGSVGTLVMNNVFNSTILIANAGMYDKGAINGKYYNNTCRMTGGGFGFLCQEDDPGVTGQDSSGAAVRNCIFIKGPDACIQGGIGGTGTFTSNFNVFQFVAGSIVVGNNPGTNYTTLSSWQSASGQDLNSIANTPTFTNASGTFNQITDYKPLSGSSPQVNIGTTLAEHTSDAGGNALVGTPDIGAWEFITGGNVPPTANAGVDKGITLPTNSVSVTGTASDSDGSIANTTWSFISGPTTPTIVSPNSLTTTINNLTVAGTYTIRLTATDNLGATGTDDMLIVVSPAAGSGTIYYISTAAGASDSNTGLSPTFVSGTNGPWRNPKRMNTAPLVAGDTVYIRAGTYDSTSGANDTQDVVINGKNGTINNHITISSYPVDWTSTNRRVVTFNLNNIAHGEPGIDVFTISNCQYVDVYGIIINGPFQTVGDGSGTLPACWVVSNSHDIIYANCEAQNCMTGFACNNSNNVKYSNCDSHNMKDPFTGPPTGPYSGADGFSRTGTGNTSNGTVYYGCRSWNNTDDGWDCFNTTGTITYDHCWAFRNGYDENEVARGDGNGFKMGPNGGTTGTILRTALFCVAAENLVNGFDQNTGTCICQFYNCGAYNNTGNDWKFGYNPPIAHYFRNNISLINHGVPDGTTTDATSWDQQYNSWQPAGGGYLGATVTTADFQSLAINLLKTQRQVDGNLPDIAQGMIAYHLTSNSDCIDKGTSVGFPFNGSAPDLGPFETNPGGGGPTPFPYSQGLIIV